MQPVNERPVKDSDPERDVSSQVRAKERESQREDVVARHHRDRGPLARQHLGHPRVRSGRDSLPIHA
jgi:hypothetical protein